MTDWLTIGAARQRTGNAQQTGSIQYAVEIQPSERTENPSDYQYKIPLESGHDGYQYVNSWVGDCKPIGVA